MALYVGFDSSTQSLTATAIEVTPSRREVLFEHTMPFDATLPGYGTRRGCCRVPIRTRSWPRRCSGSRRSTA